MRNSTIIQSIRTMLNLNEAKITEVLKRGGYDKMKNSDIEAIRQLTDSEADDCSDELLAYFLDGLIVCTRGRDTRYPPQTVQVPVTNNIVLKKLRVAFKLKDHDILDILKATGFSLSKPELTALFRREGHKNYRECGDQLLRYFLRGLTTRLRRGG